MGRKRSIVTDTLGLLLAVLVTVASVRNSVVGTHLVDQAAAAHPTIRTAWVDGSCRQLRDGSTWALLHRALGEGTVARESHLDVVQALVASWPVL
ncbi:hypothetical protein M878_08425 [Streptomyces roseochromogenus subsp. oscitans DS 12.976]|uniref:Uncharacterized protein n=1 Tax=Streptomyces roseochromogenus subsp. oscitans DS 12.976 TaxID=1352936 RepID=V6L0Y0_STRRC|nr:hypothetical protein [Streptomyces roseochromogenus]EST34879.1 hypothetical protein M878_08425 [Streptomyces roseochromogenus subsp. oscitans DS 12.976]